MRNAILCAALLAAACHSSSGGGGKTLKLATTTSVVDSGLLDQLLPAFQKAKGYKVEFASLGSGKAIDELATGKADVAVTHAPPLEEAALKEGKIASRTPFMENTFVLVGP